MSYYCHTCNTTVEVTINSDNDRICNICHESFIEDVSATSSSASPSPSLATSSSLPSSTTTSMSGNPFGGVAANGAMNFFLPHQSFAVPWPSNASPATTATSTTSTTASVNGSNGSTPASAAAAGQAPVNNMQTMHPSLFFDLFRAAGGIPPPPGMMGMPNNGAPVAGSGGLSSTSASAGVAPHVPHTMPLHGNGNNTGMGPMGGMAGMPQYGYGAPASVGGAATMQQILGSIFGGVNGMQAAPPAGAAMPNQPNGAAATPFPFMNFAQLFGGAAGMMGMPMMMNGNGNAGDYAGGNIQDLINQLMLHDPNRYGPPPASRDAVASLPERKLDKSSIDKLRNAECAVCQETFAEDDMAKELPCQHCFHPPCIAPWLAEHNTCPVCRYQLPTDDPYYEQRRAADINASRRTASTPSAPSSSSSVPVNINNGTTPSSSSNVASSTGSSSQSPVAAAAATAAVVVPSSTPAVVASAAVPAAPPAPAATAAPAPGMASPWSTLFGMPPMGYNGNNNGGNGNGVTGGMPPMTMFRQNSMPNGNANGVSMQTITLNMPQQRIAAGGMAGMGSMGMAGGMGRGAFNPFEMFFGGIPHGGAAMVPQAAPPAIQPAAPPSTATTAASSSSSTTSSSSSNTITPATDGDMYD